MNCFTSNNMKIKKLREMYPVDLREKYIRNYRKQIELGRFMRPNKSYNDLGLKFERDYLSRIGLSLILLPLEIQADYVDVVTMNSYQRMVPANLPDTIDINTVNATGIGNVAFVALHSPNEEVKAKAEKILNELLNTYCEMYGIY